MKRLIILTVLLIAGIAYAGSWNTDYDQNTSAAAGDVFVFQDVSDTTGSAYGTLKHILYSDLFTGSFQPLDSDLTAIAALTTSAYGRALLEAASEAGFKALVNLEVGTDYPPIANPIFTGNITLSDATPTLILNDTDGADGSIVVVAADSDDAYLRLRVDDSNGDDQSYIEIDGVNEWVDFNYPVVIEGTALSVTLAGKQDNITEGSLDDEVVVFDDLHKEAKWVVQTIGLGDAGTLTPTASYDMVFVSLTGTATPSAIVMTEGGSEQDQARVYITNVGPNNCTFADNPTVVELNSPVTLAQYESLGLQYKSDRWVEISRSSNTLSLASINLQTGTIQGAQKIITASGNLTLSVDQMNAAVVSTATGDINILENMCDTPTGQWLMVMANGVFVKSITSNDASDIFILYDGTNLDIGDELDTAGGAGDYCSICCMEPNKWYVTGQNGTCADGGAAD